MLSDDDITLATAARYLFETGREDAARALLRCALTVYGDEDLEFAVQRRVVITVPGGSLFMILRDDRQPVTIAIKEAITNVVPRTRLFGALPFEVKVAISFVVGFPDRDAEDLAELLRYARRSESAIFDPLPLRQQASLLLVTPLAIFPIDQVTRSDQQCFIIMPFAPAFDDVFKAIKLAVEDAGLASLRGDDIQKPGNVLAQVWRELLRSRYIIADLSLSNGLPNGNVLYELGLAHALGHEVILLTQNMDQVPYDLRGQRHIVYTPTQTGLEALTPRLAAMLKET